MLRSRKVSSHVCLGCAESLMDWLCVVKTRVLSSWRQASRVSQAVLVAGVCSMIIHLAALVSSYWQHRSNAYGSSHSGLWSVCILGRCDSFSHHQVYGKHTYALGQILLHDIGFRLHSLTHSHVVGLTSWHRSSFGADAASVA